MRRLLFAAALLLPTTPLSSDELLNRACYDALKTFRVPNAHEFPCDNTGRGGRTYTKATNIGLDIVSTLAAWETGLVSYKEAHAHIVKLLEGLESLKTYHGIFPEYIKLENGRAVPDAQNGAVRYSSIDSAWLHFGLSLAAATLRKDAPTTAARADLLLKEADYSVFLHDGNRFLRHGLTVAAGNAPRVTDFWPYNYDNKNSEARVLVLFLTAAGKLPPTVWDNMHYRAATVRGHTVAEGWKMSAFVEMVGNSYFDELRLAPKSFGASHLAYLKACLQVAEEEGLTLFGWAPCFGPDDNYREYGLEKFSVATPYAAALLTTLNAFETTKNFKKMLEFLPVTDTPKPFPDALDSKTGEVVNTRALALDQNLLFHALVKDTTRKIVSRAEWHKEACRLLSSTDERHPLR
ncbi:MAG TPA: hypothetical protein P5079_09120 [Elusimicrobiota bacterium]|nr:hypothetical protein [Elusimicrobiota bacterium]